MIRLIAVLSCVGVLAGCAFLDSVRENYESRQVLELIGYAQKIAALQAEEQRRELNASSQMLSKDRGAYARVRLALLLALPGTTFNDDAKAAELLHAQISERLREQRRAAQLKEQLEALKAIERKIIEREQARPK